MQEWLNGLEGSRPEDKTRTAEIRDQYRYTIMPAEANVELRAIQERTDNRSLKDLARLDTLDLEERYSRGRSIMIAPLNREEEDLLWQRRERLETIEEVLEILEERMGLSWRDERDFKWEEVLGMSQPPSQQAA